MEFVCEYFSEFVTACDARDGRDARNVDIKFFAFQSFVINLNRMTYM